MSEWKRALIKQETSIIEALRVLDSSAMQILIVTDNENRLLGTVTDGDVRRGILDGFSLEPPVFRVMNRNPVTAKASSPREHILALMKKRRLHQIPLVDDNGRVCGVQVVEDLLRNMEKENWVVLMAGGLGTRLRPLTDECPKPLIRIGDKPVLELIL